MSSREVEDPNKLLPAAAASLHQRMRDICHRRQKKTSGLKKTKWSIYEKEHLDKLVGDIQQLVDNLVDLFPATIPLPKTLCDEEAVEMQKETALPALRKIAAIQDKPLEEAIARLTTRGVSRIAGS